MKQSSADNRVVIVGAGRRMAVRLKRAGTHDFVVLNNEAVSCRFDETTDCWAVQLRNSETLNARIVIAGQGILHQPGDVAESMDVVGRGGQSIRDACRNGVSVYLGVAVTGFPNLFLVTGPNSDSRTPSDVFSTEAQVRYIMECLRMMGREDARRIEVHRDVQARPVSGMSYWRRLRHPNPRHYQFTPYQGELDETHRSPAVVTAGDAEIAVEVHLTGHLQPIDGSYRWYGRIARHPEVTALHKAGQHDVTMRLPGRTAVKARLTELDPWGHVRVTGTGQPPFPHS